jgi:hypothetical protein
MTIDQTAISLIRLINPESLADFDELKQANQEFASLRKVVIEEIKQTRLLLGVLLRLKDNIEEAECQVCNEERLALLKLFGCEQK